MGTMKSAIDARAELGAVVVTYNPGIETLHNIDLLLPQVARIVIVDNSVQSKIIDQLCASARHGLTILRNGDNLGIAAALNQGCAELRKGGFRWAVTFDQDSEPATDMTEKLIEALSSLENVNTIAAIGPHVCDATQQIKHTLLTRSKRFPLLFQRVDSEEDDRIKPVDMVITSGCLTNLEVLTRLGGFREEFFIDYVDTEFCFRARRHGYNVFVSPKARLFHKMGARSKFHFLGARFFPLNHSPIRRYYIARNSVPMFREYALRFPHWMLFDVFAAVHNAFRILVFEQNKREKVIMSLRGFCDGIRGRMGKFQETES